MSCITKFPDGTRTWTDGVSTIRLSPGGELSGQWQWQHGPAIPFVSDSPSRPDRAILIAWRAAFADSRPASPPPLPLRWPGVAPFGQFRKSLPQRGV